MQAVMGMATAGFDGDISVSGAAIFKIVVGFAGLFAYFCYTTALSPRLPRLSAPWISSVCH